MAYSQRDLGVAQQVIQGLFNREFNNHDLGEGVTIADIEKDVEHFIKDLRFLKEFRLNVPAIRVGEQGELIPIELSYFLEVNGLANALFGRYWLNRFEWPFMRDEIYYAISRNENQIPIDKAQSVFENLASRFLASRIAGVREFMQRQNGPEQVRFLNIFQKKGSRRIPTPGCTVRVSTNTSGLRVLWSGGYVISPKFFAAPTSPVSSTLQSGTYIFGVDGGAYGSEPQWDKVLVTLPGNPKIHLDF